MGLLYFLHFKVAVGSFMKKLLGPSLPDTAIRNGTTHYVTLSSYTVHYATLQFLQILPTATIGCPSSIVPFYDTQLRCGWVEEKPETQCALTRHGVHLQDTVCTYQTLSALTRHGVLLQDAVCTYQTRSALTRHGVHLPETGSALTRHGVHLP